MLLLLIRCGKRDAALSLEQGADLPVEGLLVRFHGQEHVGPLLQAPLKNGRVVCRASAWISTPSSSRVLSSSLRAARHLGDKPVTECRPQPPPRSPAGFCHHTPAGPRRRHRLGSGSPSRPAAPCQTPGGGPFVAVRHPRSGTGRGRCHQTASA